MASSRQQKRQNFRRSPAAKLLQERSEQLLEIEHSLFESAEYLAMQPVQPEANSKPSPHLRGVGSHSAQLSLLLEMPQSRANSLPKHFGPLAVAKTRARQPEPQSSWSRESRA